MIAHWWRGYLAFALRGAKPELAAFDRPAVALPTALGKAQADLAEPDNATVTEPLSAGQPSALEEVASFDSSAFLSIENDVAESKIDSGPYTQLAVPPAL